METLKPKLDTEGNPIYDGLDLDGNPIVANTPPGSVPGMIAHNGDHPKTAEELEHFARRLNGGFHPRDALARLLHRIHLPVRNGLGWVIIAGPAGVLATALITYEVSHEILRLGKHKDKK